MRSPLAGFLLSVFCVLPAYAGSFGVAPTTINLSSGTKSGVFYVTNRGNVPMVAQIEGFDWKQHGDTDELEPSQTLMVSPPMVKLAPKQQQTVRFAIKSGDDGTERTYRLVVSELPDHSSGSKESTIQMLLQFSIPVFVEGIKPASSTIAWGIQPAQKGVALVAQNTGDKAVKLSGITLATPSGTQTEVAPQTFSYLLPGAKRQWIVEAFNHPSSEPVHIKAHEDRDSATIEATASVGK